ncbi:peptidoglycan D,D-transpeptidase FtsI family protein [Faecalimonas sp.]
MAENRKKRIGPKFIRKKFPKRMQKKLVLVFGLTILAFVILIGKAAKIVARDGKRYEKAVLDQQQNNSRIIPFKRGDILDVNGTKMATSERAYNVILDAKVLLSGKAKDVSKAKKQTLKALEKCFDIEEEMVHQILEEKSESRYNILKREVNYKQYEAFEKLKKDEKNYGNVRGVWLEENYVRTYPYNTLASDLIGFTVAGNVANGGLEAAYNNVLNGMDGREYGYVGETASVEKIVKEATDGKSLVTSIDLNLQSIVEKHIREFNEEHKNGPNKTGLGSKNTAVIAMRPGTGEILAMASYPNFDLNNPRDLSGLFSEEQIKNMSEEDRVKELNKLWRNFCVSDTYEPGSTAKPFTIAAGLENGTLKGNETYVCPGYLDVGKWKIKCNKKDGHGTQTLKQAIANSCNVALMRIGDALGPDEFSKYQHIFGFGEYTEIDLPGEAATGTLLFDPKKMGDADLATNAFGQNFNVTMLQLAAGFNSLINGGNYYEPHVVKQIRDANGNVIENKTPVLIKKTVSEETSKIVRTYMESTVKEGTAKSAQVSGYAIGGKTGTAEKYPRNHGKNLISFIGYAPQENPEIMLYVVIDEPNVKNQASSSYAIQLAQKIMAEAFPYMNITKTETN